MKKILRKYDAVIYAVFWLLAGVGILFFIIGVIATIKYHDLWDEFLGIGLLALGQILAFIMSEIVWAD